MVPKESIGKRISLILVVMEEEQMLQGQVLPRQISPGQMLPG